MKKEIKKLQRFRDQVKQWAASNDVKDKNPLLEARRRIEVEMERFKVIEKETKTKAFSKEGLAAARVAKDPKEKAKDEAKEWINNAIEEMNAQIETFENEIDSLTSSSRKKSSRASGGGSRLTHLEESMSRHHQHIARLELCVRLVDDDALEPADAEDLKDLVEDYLERNQEDFDEFADPEDIYADLDLDNLEDVAARNKANSVNIAAELALAANKADGALASSKKASEKPAAEAATSGNGGKDEDAAPSAAERGGAKEAASHRDGAKAPKDAAPSAKKPIPAPVGKAGVLGGGAGLPVPLGLKQDGDGSGGKSIPGPKGAAPGRESALGGNGGSWGAPGGASAEGPSGLQQQQSWSFPPAGGDARDGPGAGSGSGPAYAAPQTPPAPSSSKFPLPVPGRGQQAQSRGGAGLGSPQAQPGGGGSLPSGSGSPGGKGLPAPLTFPKSASGVHSQTAPKDGGGADASPDEASAEANDAFALPPALAELLEETAKDGKAAAPRFDDGGFFASDGGKASASASVDDEKKGGSRGTPATPGVILGGLSHDDPAVHLRLLEASRRNLPRAADGAWSSRRCDAPSVPIPGSYPRSPPPVLENPALFERLDADALFFTFYHQQGTARQYLAARELKRANWRFHKKRGAWFARREEPKQSTETYEQGSYIYFDFSSSDAAGAAGGWCQRSKPDFVFHYSQLESELV